MNIFKRKKPIVVEIPVIPFRPRPLDPYGPYVLYTVKEPELNGSKVFYPIRRWYSHTVEYFTTRIKAQAACDKLNVPIEKENKAWTAKRTKQIKARNKEIAEWDAKYKIRQLGWRLNKMETFISITILGLIIVALTSLFGIWGMVLGVIALLLFSR